MPKIIISYRRADSQAMAGRIFDRLSGHYGEGAVFMDIDAIPFGSDFRKHIGEALRQCDALIAVVGPQWLGRRDDGTTRISEPDDPVRLELEGAIERQIPIIPVLIDGARMPSAAELPDSLKEFSYFNAATVDSGRDFRSHMDRLTRALDGMLMRPGEAPPGQAAAAAALGAAAVAHAAPKGTAQRVGSRQVWLALAAIVVLGGLGALVMPSLWTSRDTSIKAPGDQRTDAGLQAPPSPPQPPQSPPTKPTVTLKSADKFIAQIIGKELKESNVNVAVELDEAASSKSAKEWWDLLVSGEIDLMSVYLDELVDKMPAFAVTNMPGLVRSHEHARRVAISPFMAQIKRMAAAAGAIVLADSWVSISMISKKGCIRRPQDVKGLKVYLLGPAVESTIQAAGAVIADYAGDLTTTFKSGVDAMVVSPTSALEVAELARCVTLAGDYTFGFSYMPWLVSRKGFEKLNRDQQNALLKVGERMTALGYKDVDDYLVRMLGASGVQTVTLTQADHDAWLKLAQATVYKDFAAKVPEGKQLIDEALAVQ